MWSLFLGAGFSKWAVDLPVASQLFDFQIAPWGPRERHRLDLVKSLRQSWQTQYPGGLAEQFIAHALNLPTQSREAVLWYLARRLSEPFIWEEFHAQRWRRHVLMIDEKRKLGIPGVAEAHGFLQRFCSPSMGGIITTNYDMTVEYALGTKGFNYGVRNQRLTGRGPYPVSQWRNPVTLKGTIPLAKMHGSISWDEEGFYTDGRRGLSGHALIVPPTVEKILSQSLKPVWELARRILERSRGLVVFGFSFNPYDQAVLNLLESAGRGLESVLLIDIEPKTHQAQQVWPTSQIVPCQPPPEGNAAIRDWQAAQS